MDRTARHSGGSKLIAQEGRRTKEVHLKYGISDTSLIH